MKLLKHWWTFEIESRQKTSMGLVAGSGASIPTGRFVVVRVERGRMAAWAAADDLRAAAAKVRKLESGLVSLWVLDRNTWELLEIEIEEHAHIK